MEVTLSAFELIIASLSLISNDMPVEHEIYINDQCCWEICLVYVVDMKK